MVQIWGACKERKSDFYPELNRVFLQALLDFYLTNGRKPIDKDVCQTHFELIYEHMRIRVQ